MLAALHPLAYAAIPIRLSLFKRDVGKAFPDFANGMMYTQVLQPPQHSVNQNQRPDQNQPPVRGIGPCRKKCSHAEPSIYQIEYEHRTPLTTQNFAQPVMDVIMVGHEW